MVTILSFFSAFFGIFAVNLVLVDLFKRDRERMLRRMQEERLLRQRKEVRESALARRESQLNHLAQEALFESVSASANVGLSMGVTAPSMPVVLKVTYILQMWLGRLEFVAVFALVGFVAAGVRGR